jgi:hypothetical protein
MQLIREPMIIPILKSEDLGTAMYAHNQAT